LGFILIVLSSTTSLSENSKKLEGYIIDERLRDFDTILNTIS
jgi:hypothetical protein